MLMMMMVQRLCVFDRARLSYYQVINWTFFLYILKNPQLFLLHRHILFSSKFKQKIKITVNDYIIQWMLQDYHDEPSFYTLWWMLIRS